MILVGDIIGEVQQVTGRCDQPYLFSVLTRAVETLSNKICGVPGMVTWDPMQIYLDLPVQNDFYVYLPYQVEKPIKINLNGNPAFSHNQIYEFTQNGPGSSDLEAGWQWQDRLSKPIQRRFPRGGWLLSAVSDSESDTSLTLQIKIRSKSRNDYIIQLPITPANSATQLSTDQAYDIMEVVKPVTAGTIKFYAGPYVLAYYWPDQTLPEFAVIKLSQKAVSVRMLARRRTMKITSLLDVIPLNSSQAVIMQCQTIKYLDEVHPDLSLASESAALTYLTEEQASRNLYLAASASTEIISALNLTIGQRDTVVVADVYDDASKIFGPIGRQKVFDRITSAMEVLYNKCQYWDGLVGVVTLCSSDDYYVALPRYVDTILAMNINRTIGAYHSPWFEFSYAGLGEFGDLSQDQTNWEPWNQLAQTQGATANQFGVATCGWNRINGSNRLAKGWEEVGSTPLAFRLKGPAQLYAVPELGQDNGSRLTIYGYDQNDNPVLDSSGNWGVEVPCYTNRTTPSKQIFARVERVSKDPSYGFINLYATNPFAAPGAAETTDFISMYWPWDTEPMYRLIRVGTMCKRVRIRYKRNWLKITQLTDPLHVRSREAIIMALTAISGMRSGLGGGTNAAMSSFMPTAPVQVAMDQLQMAVSLLDDEWSARNPNATITLQWARNTYGNAFPQVM